jgi:hypothetical protein
MKTLKAKVLWLWNSYIWNPLHLKSNIRKANKMHLMSGKRYFVVPISDTRLAVVDNTYVNDYNRFASKQRKGSKIKKININDLIRMAYYATSTRRLVNGR